MVKTFDDIRKLAKKRGKKVISIAMPESLSILEAVKELKEEGMIDAVLVGDSENIKKLLDDVRLDIDRKNIIHATDPVEAGYLSVQAIKDGAADILMKGRIPTPDLMKAVLDKEKGLRKGNLLSHVAVAEAPNYDRLLIVSDGGINIRPDVEKKIQIIKNAIVLAKSLGIAHPKIGILCPIERVNPKIPETVDAAELVKLTEKGEFGDVSLEGPIAMDVILSEEAAAKKGIESKIAGKTDIIIVHDVTTGNAILKTLIWLVGAKVGGVVLGAKVPIVLLSRSDTKKEKMLSMLLSIVCC
ncbi:MAG TPA: phosphate butyryltransferase [Candidatus Marinimicrobia bacterium]|nr:phosphate butyryltransferase [Candidatus Neomarinimicrobiota bacterium]